MNRRSLVNALFFTAIGLVAGLSYHHPEPPAPVEPVVSVHLRTIDLPAEDLTYRTYLF